MRRLAWEETEVRVADSLDSATAALTAERDENTCRKELYEPAVRGRELAGVAAEQTLGSRDPGVWRRRVREEVGEALGVSGAHLERIAAVARDAGDETLPAEQREAAARTRRDAARRAARGDERTREGGWRERARTPVPGYGSWTPSALALKPGEVVRPIPSDLETSGQVVPPSHCHTKGSGQVDRIRIERCRYQPKIVGGVVNDRPDVNVPMERVS
jgi:hypothetical protein